MPGVLGFDFSCVVLYVFFFNDTATTEIYSLSLHDALPISPLMARAFGGWWFNYAGWNHGPFARLTYEEVKVYAGSEQGTTSTAVSCGHQQREAFVSRLGWQAAGSIGSVRPYARVTWEKDYNNDDRTVRAGLVSTGGGGFGLPALRPDDSYVLFDVGASADLGSVGIGRITGFVSVNATAAKGDGNYQ